MKPCYHCGGPTEWFTKICNQTLVANGRLKTSDVNCVFVRGCTYCGETVELKSADDIAAILNAPAEPVLWQVRVWFERKNPRSLESGWSTWQTIDRETYEEVLRTSRYYEYDRVEARALRPYAAEEVT